ncbi:hypothetical protein lbkm_1460 [Lachnospiraceae bacterium KM106-2]|nr:hypothetical protein lbkm_1460 [Lachnospiraceae bacterium KM106-2]
MSKKMTEMLNGQVEIMFYNLKISMKTCNWKTLICGTPVWRYFYHTIHSCDKWFINPYVFTEPEIHVPHLDQVDLACDKVLTKEEIWAYYDQVHNKVTKYLNGLSDEELYEKPENCDYTRIELIFGQVRHFMCHVGIFNGITIANTGKYPMVVGMDAYKNHKMDGKLYDE